MSLSDNSDIPVMRVIQLLRRLIDEKLCFIAKGENASHKVTCNQRETRPAYKNKIKHRNAYQ